MWKLASILSVLKVLMVYLHYDYAALLMNTEISYRQFVLNCLGNQINTIHGFGVSSLALFGSVARDEATPTSDLDFLVEFEGTATFDGYMDLKFFLEDLFDRPVDLVTRKSLKSQISQTVLAEAIEVTN
jgi:uncharacterized protein